MIYAQVFTEYRKYYLLIDKSEDYKKNVRITENFKAFEQALDLAPTMSSNNDGNYYAFIHLFKALRALINSCEIIINYYKARKYYENIYELNFIVE